MTRKFSRNYSLSVVVPFIAILILLIATAALAQTSGAGPTSGKANAVLALAGVSALAQAERPLSPWTGAGSSPVSRPHTKRHGAHPMDGGPPLFLPAVTYPSGGAWPTSAAVADVNGDGKPDIVVANSGSNTVGVLLGNGDGTFQPAVTYDSGGVYPWSVAVADLNGDGAPDIVVVNCNAECQGGEESTAGVLLNNGDGTFREVVTYDTGEGGYAMGIAIADVNGDGKPDLVIANCGGCFGYEYPGSVSVLLGNGDGTFQGAWTYLMWWPSSVAVTDVNGDGRPDIVVATGGYVGEPGQVGVLLGNGDGTFQSAGSYDSSGAFSVAVADLNGDGKPDIAVANLGSNTAGVLLGNGDGTFQSAVTYDSGGDYPSSIAVADVNGDSKPDLLIANVCHNSPYCWNGVVGVLLGNGDGTFQTALIYDTGAGDDISPQWLAVADVNGDGTPDVIVANVYSGNVSVLLNNTGPHASTTTALASSLNPSTYGEAVTFTAAVSSPGGVPTGTVVFSDGSNALGSVTLVNGQAAFLDSLLAAGSHSITAAYQGSTSFSPSTSAPLNQVVNTATTTTSLASSLNPALINELLTYTATVASQYGGAVTGTVVFQDGGSTVATVNMTSNQAAYTTSYKTPGTHAITATYSGDANNTGSVSATLVEQINTGGFPSKTVLVTSGSPSFVGQPVTFTATVTSSHGAIPDGDLVTFYDSATAIATGATASGVATFTTSSLTVRTHTIKAAYNGDAKFKPSTGSVKQIVVKYPTTTALSSSPNPSQSGQAVTFTTSVTSTGPTPTGKVTFKDGTKSLGSRKLSGGAAALTTSRLAVGTHSITAEYLGDANNATGTSPVLYQVVQ